MICRSDSLQSKVRNKQIHFEKEALTSGQFPLLPRAPRVQARLLSRSHSPHTRTNPKKPISTQNPANFFLSSIMLAKMLAQFFLKILSGQSKLQYIPLNLFRSFSLKSWQKKYISSEWANHWFLTSSLKHSPLFLGFCPPSSCQSFGLILLRGKCEIGSSPCTTSMHDHHPRHHKNYHEICYYGRERRRIQINWMLPTAMCLAFPRQGPRLTWKASWLRKLTIN